MKKVIVVGFFIVVFGFPVSWYLILQLFGENQFDIPAYGQVAKECLVTQNAYLQLRAEGWDDRKNELNRLKRKFDSVEPAMVELVLSGKCLSDTIDAVLVDHSGVYRGFYKANRQEVDRILTEVDIYLNNIGKDGSGEQ